MYAFLFSDANTFFSIAIGIVCVIALLEVLGQLIGFSIGQLLDSSFGFDAELSTDSGVDAAQGNLAALASWLCLKRLPFLVWLIMFLTLFSISGYGSNYISFMLVDDFLPSFISASFAMANAMFLSHFLGSQLAKVIPKEETSAISQDSFSGRLAQITIGTARKGMPAEAVFKDEFEQKHYVMVEPIDDDEFCQGANVVLVTKQDKSWLVTRFD